jgi:hypothetical protein
MVRAKMPTQQCDCIVCAIHTSMQIAVVLNRFNARGQTSCGNFHIKGIRLTCDVVKVVICFMNVV